MLSKLLSAWLLMAICVAIHAVGVTTALRRVKRRPVLTDSRFWSSTWMLVRVAGWTILLHMLEIAVWAVFYTWKEGMPDIQSAIYFSAVTYTTTGYGDLVLPETWRLVGAVEALTGILMCGWSTGFFFTVVNRVLAARSGTESQ
jgi:voltage-gated potassium channel Kch